MFRSLGAVIIGYLIFAVPAVAFFALTGRNPHAPAPLVFMVSSTLYGMFFAALGGYLAGRLAGRHPLRHAIALTVVIALGAIVSMATSPAHDAIWSQVTALCLMAPSATVGGLPRRN